MVGEIYVRRIDLSEVPEDDDGSADFLNKLYKTKASLIGLSCVAIMAWFAAEAKKGIS